MLPMGMTLGMAASRAFRWTPAALPGSARYRLPGPTDNYVERSTSPTTLAAANDPVGSVRCPLTGVFALAPSDAARPILRTDGRIWWWEFDGADDCLRTAPLYSFAGGDPIMVAVACRPAGTGNGPSGAGQHAGGMGLGASGQLRDLSIYGGSWLLSGYGADYTGPASTAGRDTRLVARVRSAGAAVRMLTDGTALAGATGSMLNAVSGGRSSIGTDPGDGTGLFGGRVYGWIETQGDPTDADLSAVDGYLLGRLPPQIGFIGDSMTVSGTDATVAAMVSQRGRQYGGVNRGVNGSTTTDWLPAGSLLTPAMDAIVAAGARTVSIALGTNDSKSGGPANSASTYAANLTAIVAACVARGLRAVVHAAPYADPANGFGVQNSLLAQYRDALLAGIAGATTGDTTAYAAFAAAPSLLSGDGVHPTATGYATLGGLRAGSLP